MTLRHEKHVEFKTVSTQVHIMQRGKRCWGRLPLIYLETCALQRKLREKRAEQGSQRPLSAAAER
jgi:hypothetical protein